MCDLCVCVNVHMRADSAVMQICAFVLLFNKNLKKEKRKKTAFITVDFGIGPAVEQRGWWCVGVGGRSRRR